ncbi:7728_t:CDS:2 [Cetraspora pellucida]|uniref:7728_t:CDS:1 n=1 Tax=Cetraspora pellucida TaxID=1433469 RepID=A0A9N9G1B0_9GLOM|nr:7728_t:CDS:2 [Cetraspora pellucida]
MSDFSEKIESCYALPFGVFGFICWALSLLSNFFILFGNLPLFSPWLWCRPAYQSQNLSFAFIAFVMTIGPTIYTCIRCREEWVLIVSAVGQLSPWAFKMINDATASKSENSFDRDNFYTTCGVFLSVLLSSTGWVGLVALIIKLEHTQYEVTSAIFFVFAPFIFVICIPFVKGDSRIAFRCMIGYVAATTHLIGTHYILGKVSGDFTGLRSAGFASAVIFFVGKRLLFLDMSCSNC